MINEKRLPRAGCLLEKTPVDYGGRCESCGNNVDVHNHRMRMIRAGKLTEDRYGCMHLDLRTREE